MTYDFMGVFRLVCATLFPGIVSVLLCVLLYKTRLGKGKKWLWQSLYGLAYGTLAVLSIEFRASEATCPLIIGCAIPSLASLLFEGPSGIIAGLIGAGYRLLAQCWGKGDLACYSGAFAFAFSGLFGYLLRRFVYDKKPPFWLSGLLPGLTIAVFENLLAFLFNMGNIDGTFDVLSPILLPSVLCNAFLVPVGLLGASLVCRNALLPKVRLKKVGPLFQVILSGVSLFAFLLGGSVTYCVQVSIAENDAETILKTNKDDILTDTVENLNLRIFDNVSFAKSGLKLSSSKETLQGIASFYNFSEASILNGDGKIITSTDDSLLGYKLSDNRDTTTWLQATAMSAIYISDFDPVSLHNGEKWKYSLSTLNEEGYLMVGYDEANYSSFSQDVLASSIANRHIGKTGGVVCYDQEGQVWFDYVELSQGKNKYALSDPSLIKKDLGSSVKNWTIGGASCHCLVDEAYGLFTVVFLPDSEIYYESSLSITALLLLETEIFALLYLLIYVLANRLVVKKVEGVNASLQEIASGNLLVKVDEKGTEEFESLSHNINATVDSLKGYIEEAKTRMEKDLELASLIQGSSLPSFFPSNDSFALFAKMVPAKEVGGDFYDFYFLDKDNLVFLIADVSGKGIPGAMFMMRSKATIKGLAENGLPLDKVFEQANASLEKDNAAEMFVTAWMGKLNLKTGLLEYVNAGHNPPLIKRGNGEFEYIRTAPNFVLAGMEGTHYSLRRTTLKKGDVLFLYTDGVSEACNSKGEFYGEKRLRELLSADSASLTPSALIQKVACSLESFVGEAPASDDVTMLCVEFKGEGEDALSLKPSREALEKVSGYVEKRAKALGSSSDLCGKLGLVSDEIFSNIVKYSLAEVASVRLDKEDSCYVLTFAHDGPKFNPFEKSHENVSLPLNERKKEGGLGLLIVKKLADEFSYSYQDGKNIITLRFDEKSE